MEVSALRVLPLSQATTVQWESSSLIAEALGALLSPSPAWWNLSSVLQTSHPPFSFIKTSTGGKETPKLMAGASLEWSPSRSALAALPCRCLWPNPALSRSPVQIPQTTKTSQPWAQTMRTSRSQADPLDPTLLLSFLRIQTVQQSPAMRMMAMWIWTVSLGLTANPSHRNRTMKGKIKNPAALQMI